jgi:hypothetical protein
MPTAKMSGIQLAALDGVAWTAAEEKLFAVISPELCMHLTWIDVQTIVPAASHGGCVQKKNHSQKGSSHSHRA